MAAEEKGSSVRLSASLARQHSAVCRRLAGVGPVNRLVGKGGRVSPAALELGGRRPCRMRSN